MKRPRRQKQRETGLPEDKHRYDWDEGRSCKHGDVRDAGAAVVCVCNVVAGIRKRCQRRAELRKSA